MLYESGEPLRHVYFPNDCLVSLLVAVADRKALEVGLVGREGMVGLRSRWEWTLPPFAPWCREPAPPCA